MIILTRHCASTVGGIAPEDLAAEQVALNELRAACPGKTVTKIEYEYREDGTTVVSLSAK